jgi:hypothetical protein
MQHRTVAGEPDADRALLFGLVLIVVGVAFLFDRLAFVDLELRFWPFILIVLGAVKLLTASRPGRVSRSLRPGVWLLFIGLWLLVNENHLFGLDYETSWPLMIIGGGLMIVWRAFEGPGACACSRQEP